MSVPLSRVTRRGTGSTASRSGKRVRFKVVAGGVEKGDTWLASVSNKSEVITPIFSKLTLQAR